MALDGSGRGPQAEPLYSLQELQLWSPQQQVHKKNIAVPLAAETGVRVKPQHIGAGSAPTEKPNAATRPRLLVCHDLQGGYQDDKWLDGGNNAEAYRIWHWRLIDTFVYFSHHLVTIPPATWTSAAHRNHVKVLGTFITEWDEGAAICKETFSSIESAHRTADQLIAIARHHNFEGWLLNFENAIDPAQIPTLIDFVRYLTSGMHVAMPGGEVIWYDSVTTEGKLEWQDGLTLLNMPFFAAADGLFVNYTWKEESPVACALGAMHRASDVYMGVDVFGRGTFGGGGYHADVAFAAAQAAGVSAALFAPGWVFENREEAGADFEQAQERFWGKLQRQWPAARPAVTSLPFESDFNEGVGRFWRLDGALVSEGPWNNLTWQNVQPLHHHARLRSANGFSHLEAKVTFDRAFNGGSAYEIQGPLARGDSAAVRLFDGIVTVEAAQRLCVSFTVSASPASHVALVLRLQSTEGNVITVICDTDASSEKQLELNEARESPNQEDVGKTRTTADGTKSPEQSQDPPAVNVGKPGSPQEHPTVRCPGGMRQGDTAGQQRGDEVLQHGSTHSVLWARLKRSNAHVNGWRTSGFELTQGLVAKVTDVGAVCYWSENCGLLMKSPEQLWDAMERNVEEAWICREREEGLEGVQIGRAQEATSSREPKGVNVGLNDPRVDTRPVGVGPDDRAESGSGQAEILLPIGTGGTESKVGRKMLKERNLGANVSTDKSAVQQDSIEGTLGRGGSVGSNTIDVQHDYSVYIGHVVLELETNVL